MASARERCILPLPPDVVAQIKSSTAIVSLTDAVLELLKNALDAGATTIEATIDFGRGGCSVEDDGRGIAPLEFREEGGLGKFYCQYLGLYHVYYAYTDSPKTPPNIIPARPTLDVMAHFSPLSQPCHF
jgi:hypothetical protein